MVEQAKTQTQVPSHQNIALENFPEEVQEKLKKHLTLVLKANENINLTRISTYDEGLLLHVEDSLVAYPEIMKAPEGPYADLGTGAGFPGIPLAVVTQRETTLVDSVGKKGVVLNSIIEELELIDRVGVYIGRIEDLANEQSTHFSVITARALSSLTSLLELSAPLLKKGGHLICYKARISEDELENALAIQSKLGMQVASDRNCTLSDGLTERRILVFKKVGNPTIKLPRRMGMAQKKPLVP